MFYFSYQKYCSGAQYYYLRRILGESLCVSRATAFLLYFNCFLILLPVCKSLLTWLRVHIQKYIKGAHRRLFNHNNKFHIVIGISVVVLSLPVYTGIAMLLILAVLVFGSLPPVRRSRFEIFWYSHHLSIAFFAFLVVHGFGGIVKYQTNIEEHHPGCEFMMKMKNSNFTQRCEGKPNFAPDPPQAWKWIVAPLFLYAIEKIVRFISARKPIQVTKAIFHSGEILELRMKKQGFSALPGQFVRLNCRDISHLEWHPFTLTECPTEESSEFAVHIKVAGDWTELLATLLQNMVIVNKHVSRVGDSWTISVQDTNPGVMAIPVEETIMRLQVDGPYGSPFQDVSRFRVAFIITTGIGVTPFAAVLNHIRHTIEESKSYGKLTKLYFLWVCKTHDDFSWFLDILYRTNIQLNSNAEEEMMSTRLFVTRSQALSEMASKSSIDPSLYDQRRQWLVNHLQCRRPVWKEEFEKIDCQHENERIGVFFCGSKAIHPTLHQICNKKTNQKNTYVFHKESF
eukprot:gene17361-8953_t